MTIRSVQCTAMAKVRDPVTREPLRDENGKFIRRRCKKRAIMGGTVCIKHGGAAPLVKARAQERLLALVDPALAELSRILRSKSADDSDKIRAAITILDRVRETARIGKSEHSGPDGGPIPHEHLLQVQLLRRALADPALARSLDETASQLHVLEGTVVDDDDAT